MAKVKIRCQACGLIFQDWPSNKRKYCSPECTGTQFKRGQEAWNKGKSPSPETIEKLRESHLGQEAWNKGEKVTLLCAYCNNKYLVHPCREDEAKYCSHKCFTDHRKESGSTRGTKSPLWGTSRPDMINENNPNWNGGNSKAYKKEYWGVRYKRWRTMVFERDNYTCQRCNTQGGTLEAHHEKPWRDFPDLRFKVDNGKTLCLECHISVDKYRARFIPKEGT